MYGHLDVNLSAIFKRGVITFNGLWCTTKYQCYTVLECCLLVSAHAKGVNEGKPGDQLVEYNIAGTKLPIL